MQQWICCSELSVLESCLRGLALGEYSSRAFRQVPIWWWPLIWPNFVKFTEFQTWFQFQLQCFPKTLFQQLCCLFSRKINVKTESFPKVLDTFNAFVPRQCHVLVSFLFCLPSSHWRVMDWFALLKRKQNQINLPLRVRCQTSPDMVWAEFYLFSVCSVCQLLWTAVLPYNQLTGLISFPFYINLKTSIFVTE